MVTYLKSAKRSLERASIKISVVIPTLNERNFLAQTIDGILSQAANPGQIEILVVDAGSTDGTLDSISNYEVGMFSKPEFALRKFMSLNFGMKHANGETLIFLDADTKLPTGFDRLIIEKLQHPNVVGGAFEFSFNQPDWKLKIIEVLNRIRYRLDRTYYGDQAVFCKKNVALEIGGFPEKQLMESAFFCKELLKVGKLGLIRYPIKTSPRRFNKHGFFKVTRFDVLMWVRFILNLPVEEYGKKYWGVNLKSDD